MNRSFYRNSARSILTTASLAIVMSWTVATAQAAQPPSTIEGRVPVSQFANRATLQMPRLSPDASKMAAKVSYKGVEYLAIFDLTGKTPTDYFLKTEAYKEFGDRRIISWRWVGNRTLVVTAASGEIGMFEGEMGRLFSYDVEGKKLAPLAWKDAAGSASDIIHVDHKNERLLLSRTSLTYGYEYLGRPEVIDVDVRTGRFKLVQKPNILVGGWAADGKGVVRMGVGYDRDSGKTRILYRATPDENLKTIYDKADPTFSGDLLVPEIFLAEEGKAIVTSNKDGFNKVYKIDLATMELGEPIFAVEGYDVGELGCNESCDRLQSVSVVENRSKIYWMDERLKAVQDMFEQQFGAGNARIVSSDIGDKNMLVWVGKTNQTGIYYSFNADTGKVARIGYSNEYFGEAEMNPTKTIVYPASDGEKIHAVVTMPRHREGQRNLPVVMITHGGPFGPRDEEGFGPFAWHQAIAELGYVVVQPNYRGSGGYGRDWIKKGRDDGFGLRMQDDLNDAIDYLAAQGTVDPKRACMMGWSYGGYASARAAQRDPARWRCTIAGAGVYDLGEMRKYDRNYLGRFGSNYLSKGTADLDTVSPTQNAEGKWSPILIVHGVKDDRVPLAQAKGLVSALERSGKVRGQDFDYLYQPDNTHNFPAPTDEAEFLEATRKWLERFNPAYVASDADKAPPVSAAK